MRFLIAASILAAGTFAAAQQNPSRSVWEGVYTAAQAERGTELFAGHCASCHGEDMKGGPGAPSLVGAEFMFGWANRTAGDFFGQIQETMPLDAPGAMTPEQYADIVAAVFKANAFPPGTGGELPAARAALNDVLISKKN